MRLLKLTHMDGKPVYMEVTRIEVFMGGSFNEEPCTNIGLVSRNYVAVRETVEEVAKAITKFISYTDIS